MQIKRVRIIKGAGWYTQKIGEIYEVAEIARAGHKYGIEYAIADDIFKKSGLPDKIIRLSDAEELAETRPLVDKDLLNE